MNYVTLVESRILKWQDSPLGHLLLKWVFSVYGYWGLCREDSLSIAILPTSEGQSGDVTTFGISPLYMYLHSIDQPQHYLWSSWEFPWNMNVSNREAQNLYYTLPKFLPCNKAIVLGS